MLYVRRILRKLTRQRQLPGLANNWGAIKITWTHLAIYVNAATFLMMTATFYRTTASVWIAAKFNDWTPGYPLFLLAIMTLLGLIALFWEFKFSLPSVFRFQQDQLYEHSEIFRADIKQILSDNDELKGQVEALLVKLEDLEK